MNTELYWLTVTVIFTGCLWMPYIVNRIIEHGLIPALRNPKPDQPPKAAWANRLMHAHNNAVENLVIFTPLVLALTLLEISSPATILAVQVYFATRVAHALIYTFGIAYLRTIAFFIGFCMQMLLAYNIVTHL